MSPAIDDRILRAATEEFARHGLGGARVARIADAAGANKERLYHYFGNKQELFAAVLDDATRRIDEAEPFETDDLGAYVAAMVDFHQADPTLVHLLLAEARHHTRGRLTREDERRAHYEDRVAAVRRAQRDGTVRSDVDARVVVYAVLALVVTAEALPELTELILGADRRRRPLSPTRFRTELRRLVDALVEAT